MRPPAPAARDTPTSRTGTPPAAGALPGEARPERSPTRGKAAPPFGAPDAQPGVLPDAQPGTGPDAGAECEAERAAPRAPQGSRPPGRGIPAATPPPCGHSPDGYSPGKRPSAGAPSRGLPSGETLPAQAKAPPGAPRPPDGKAPGPATAPPSRIGAARARAPSPLPPLFLLLFLIGHTLRKGFPEGYGQGFWKEPRQDFRDGWRKRRARPGPTRRGTPRRTRCGTPPQASGRPHPCAPAWPPSAGIPASP